MAIGLDWIWGGRDWTSFTAELDMETRQNVYQSLTGVSGGLLGFFIATVAILLGVDSDRPRMKAALAGQNRSRVQSFFFAGIRSISLVLVVFVLMLMLDKEREPAGWIEPVMVAGMVVVALRTTRIIWILHHIVAIAGHDAEA